MAYLASELYSAFPTTSDCQTLRSHIDSLIINEAYWRTELKKSEADASASLRKLKEEKFNLFACELELGQKKVAEIAQIEGSYGASAKAKIETDTKEAITKRIIVGVSVVVLALGIILAFKNKQ
jgi:hypothetical protein